MQAVQLGGVVHDLRARLEEHAPAGVPLVVDLSTSKAIIAPSANSSTNRASSESSVVRSTTVRPSSR